MKQQFQVGGQAVIEGVMMRSKDAYSVAVRRADGSILVRVRPFSSFIRKYKFFGLPIVRGAFVLLESLILGVQALTFSGDIANDDEKARQKGERPPTDQVADKSALQNLWLGLTVAFSFALGLFIFFYIPLIITEFLGADTGFWFNLIDGVLRLSMFLGYLVLITYMKDIRRVFEYHGAEHKSIFALEKEKELTPVEADLMSRFHPRCGTSFLLIVMMVSIFVFMFLGKPDSISEKLIRLAFIPVIGGISYEFIKLSGSYAENALLQPLILPGLWLQKLTTREPDKSQLEVAIVALKAALGMELESHENIVIELPKVVRVK